MVQNTSVADRHALMELKHRYCFHIDHGDYEAWADLFTDDGAFHRPGGDTYRGQPELIEFGRDVFDTEYDYSAHFVSNPIIDVDGDQATGQWYLHLARGLSDGSVGWVVGDYEDTFEKAGETWQIESVTMHPIAAQSTQTETF